MIVLHAGFRNSCLMFWGEKPAESNESVPVKRRGRPAATTRRVSNLPFDAGDKALKGLRRLLQVHGLNLLSAISLLYNRKLRALDAAA
jgi:hypothetical protein